MKHDAQKSDPAIVNSQANWYQGRSESLRVEGRSQSTTHRESCAGRREAVGEALTAGHADGTLSTETVIVRSAETVLWVEGNTGRGARASCDRTPRCLRTHVRMHALHRDLGDLPAAPDRSQIGGRIGKEVP